MDNKKEITLEDKIKEISDNIEKKFTGKTLPKTHPLAKIINKWNNKTDS